MNAHAMPLEARRLAELIEENDALREEVRQLRALLVPVGTFPASLGLTPSERDLLLALMAVGAGVASIDRLMAALYGLQPEEEPLPNIISVFLCRLRSKLAGYGVSIEHHRHRGWRIAPGGIPILQALIECERAAA